MNPDLKKIFSPFGLNLQVGLWIVILSFVLYISTILFGFSEGLSRGGLIFVCHIVNFYIFYSWLVPKYYETKKFASLLLFGIASLVILTSIRFYIENQFVFIPGSPASGLSPARGRIGFILFSELSITVFASLLRLASVREATKRRVDDLEKLQMETELKFLKMQMNPHFLFNTINNVYSLALIKSDKAPQALLKLSALLRYLLYECHDTMPLEREIEALETYKDLFQLKFEKPLNITIDNKASRSTILLEPLLLIPLLENALKHSGIGLADEAFAKFTIAEERDVLHITVVNSKMISRIADEPGGIGLENMQKRMQRLSPGHSIEIIETDSLFTVKMQIPFI